MEPSDRDRGHRPLAFDKMEGLVREMQDPETGVPVRSQKQFLTSIPSAFMGYDLIEWLMERLNIEESVEAVHIANQLCQYGYFFPVSDSKNLIVKDDSSLYRFQTPYYWPWQHRSPDNVEYAIYLAKRTLRNKQRHGLEEYEMESLNSLKKTLQNKWDFISMQAEEQVRLAKDRKKGDKIVSDSQERAYWRVYRTPPGYLNCLEPSPVPNRTRGASRLKKRTQEDLMRDVDFLRSSLVRTRVKVSQALDNLIQHSETYNEYDPFMTPAQPSNPWVTEDPTFWQLNGPLVELPTEKRVKRWSLSMEELVVDPTGLQEFTNYLRKEYSHENIRYWTAVNDLRRSAQSQIQHKVREIFDEFLAPGAPCEINIDGKTMEKVHLELRNPSRFTFDSAAEHVYTLLLKKDCYPRFIRSEHYKNLLANGIQPLQKKRFFGFGGPTKKKSSTTTAPNSSGLLQQTMGQSLQSQGTGQLGRRRGSERSLTGSVHELAISGIREVTSRVSHSHSQSNLSDIPYRGDLPCQSQASSIVWSNSSLEPSGGPASAEKSVPVAEKPAVITEGPKDDVCPWDLAEPASSEESPGKPVEEKLAEEAVEPRSSRKNSSQLDSSSSSDISAAMAEVTSRLRQSFLAQQDSCSSGPETGRSASEERAMPQQRKFSTASVGPRPAADSRRPSLAAKLADSARPSMSSSEDLPPAGPGAEAAAPEPDSDKTSEKGAHSEPCPPATHKKSGRKKSTTTVPAAPIISVSSAAEEVDDNTGEMLVVDEPEAAAAAEAAAEVSPRKPNVVVCPWEDEANCRVDTPFVKTYATLGYL